MIFYKKIKLNSRQKIALFFTTITTVFFLFSYGITYTVWETQWKETRNTYTKELLESIPSREEAQINLKNCRILDKEWNIIYNEWILKDISLSSQENKWEIIKRWEHYFYLFSTKMKDGDTIYHAANISYFIYQRNTFIKKILILYIITITIAYITGYYFARWMLRPLKCICQTTQSCWENKEPYCNILLSGDKNDEIVQLSRHLHDLFEKIKYEQEKIEQFSADLTHEMKNQIFELMSYAQVAQKTGDKENILWTILAHAKEMQELIHSLMILLRDGNHILKTPTNIKKLIELHKLKDPRIIYKLENSVQNIDAELFYVAVSNLIGNAQKFTPEDGRIFIELYEDRLEIRDTGKGISKKELHKIWDRFFKTDMVRSPGSGYGLGLSIVEKIISAHNFKIDVKSALGRGTTFIIYFL